MFTSIKLFKESLDANGLSDQQREDLKGRFNAILEIQDFDFELAEVDVYEEINNLPEHQRLEAEEIWEDVMTEHENGTSGYYESKISKINESSTSELNDYLEGKSRRSGRFDIAYYAETTRDGKVFLEVVADSKRGYPRDAFIIALTSGKPSLPSGWEYVTGTPVDYSMKEVTRETIKADDEYYDDRGYTDSEFSGSVRYEIKQTMNESHDMTDAQIDAHNDHFNNLIYDIEKTKPREHSMSYWLGHYCYDNYSKVTGLDDSEKNNEGDFPDIMYDLMDHFEVGINDFQDAWNYYADYSK